MKNINFLKLGEKKYLKLLSLKLMHISTAKYNGKYTDFFFIWVTNMFYT